MNSRIVQRMRRDDFERREREAQGHLPAIASFVSDRAANANIPDTSKLPVLENYGRLQNDAGQNYFFFGYSAFDGPDILP